LKTCGRRADGCERASFGTIVYLAQFFCGKFVQNFYKFFSQNPLTNTVKCGIINTERRKEVTQMKHSIEEIYIVHSNVSGANVMVTEQYVIANNIPTPKYRERSQHLVYARPLLSHLNHNKPIAVRDVDDVTKLIYLFGEKSWFDSQEELDAYRVEYQRERALSIAKNKLKKAIGEKLDDLSIEELEAMLLALS